MVKLIMSTYTVNLQLAYQKRINQSFSPHYPSYRYYLQYWEPVYFFVAHASGMARYRDLVLHPFVPVSIHPSVINICDHPNVHPTVQICYSETFRDTFTKFCTNIKHHQRMCREPVFSLFVHVSVCPSIQHQRLLPP